MIELAVATSLHLDHQLPDAVGIVGNDPFAQARFEKLWRRNPEMTQHWLRISCGDRRADGCSCWCFRVLPFGFARFATLLDQNKTDGHKDKVEDQQLGPLPVGGAHVALHD